MLAVPGFLYYLLTEKGKNRYRPLNIFGPKKVAATYHLKRGKKIPDTIYHQIRDFTLLNQIGDSVRFKADTGKITVVDFFYTQCPSGCLQANSAMAKVVDVYRSNRMVRFFSISVDPIHDTPEALLRYSRQFKADPSKWSFLTGPKDYVYPLATRDFLVDVLADSTASGKIVHTQMLILVDPKKRIRGFYDAGSKEQVDKLIDEIKVQIAEELRQVTDL